MVCACARPGAPNWAAATAPLVQQGRQECPIGPVEAHLLLAQLAFQHRDLMAQGKDLHVFVPVVHG
jgi:hypothetical protein